MILLLLSKYRMHKHRICMINIRQYDTQRELEKIRNYYKENKNPVWELKFPLLERQSITNEVKKSNKWHGNNKYTNWKIDDNN